MEQAGEARGWRDLQRKEKLDKRNTNHTPWFRGLSRGSVDREHTRRAKETFAVRTARQGEPVAGAPRGLRAPPSSEVDPRSQDIGITCSLGLPLNSDPSPRAGTLRSRSVAVFHRVHSRSREHSALLTQEALGKHWRKESSSAVSGLRWQRRWGEHGKKVSRS